MNTPQPEFDTPIPDRKAKGLRCPSCGEGVLKTQKTIPVGPSSRVRRAQCQNPKCRAVHSIVQFVVEDCAPDKLASELLEGKVRVSAERRNAFTATGQKLRTRL